jgi:hypothetical protein
VTSVDGRKLETEQLFWEPRKGIVYSEKFTKMTEKDGSIATGIKFSSNQDFTNAKLTKGSATIILKDEETTVNPP